MSKPVTRARKAPAVALHLRLSERMWLVNTPSEVHKNLDDLLQLAAELERARTVCFLNGTARSRATVARLEKDFTDARTLFEEWLEERIS